MTLARIVYPMLIAVNVWAGCKTSIGWINALAVGFIVGMWLTMELK